MAIKFIDLEKAEATIPREMTMGTLGWMRVPEVEVRMVEASNHMLQLMRESCSYTYTPHVYCQVLIDTAE